MATPLVDPHVQRTALILLDLEAARHHQDEGAYFRAGALRLRAMTRSLFISRNGSEPEH